MGGFRGLIGFFLNSNLGNLGIKQNAKQIQSNKSHKSTQIPVQTIIGEIKKSIGVIPKNMNGQNRSDIYPGLEVDIILKKDQRTGTLTRGFVKRLLTSAAYHSRGIKVQLDDGQVGRVAWIVEEED